MAAAIGAGLPVHEPTGNMVVDIGGGTTEVAVISLGGIVTSQSVRIGGDELDEAIVSFVKKEFSLALGERTAEEIKITLGSAYPLEQELHAEIRGRDLVSGLPKTIVVSTEEIRRAIEEPVSAIIDAVKVTLDRTPPGAGGRHHGAGHRAHRRRGAAARAGVPPAARDRHAHRGGPGPAELRGHRQRPVPGRVRSAEAGADHHFHALTERPVSSWVARSRRSRRTLTVVILVVLSLSLISLDLNGRTHSLTSGVKSVANDVYAPLRQGVLDIVEPHRQLLRRRRSTTGRSRPQNEQLQQDHRAAAGRRRPSGLRGEPAAPADGAAEPALPAVARRRSRRRPWTSTRPTSPPPSRSTRAVPTASTWAIPVVGAGGLVGQVIQSFHHTCGRAARHRRPVQGRRDLRAGQPAHRHRRRAGARRAP